MNLTDALISLCHPLHDITDYLTIPKGQDLASVNRMKDQFCQVNFTVLEEEYKVLEAKIQEVCVNIGDFFLTWFQLSFNAPLIIPNRKL